jgi:TrkA domain protein
VLAGGAGLDGHEPSADGAEQLDPAFAGMGNDHLAHADPAVEVDLVVGLIALRPDLDDELSTFDTAIGEMLRAAVELIRHPVVVVGPEETGLHVRHESASLGDRADHHDESRAQPLVRPARRRNHVQHPVPHLVANIQAQPAALVEHRLGRVEHEDPHGQRVPGTRLSNVVAVNVEVTPLPGIGVRKDFALPSGRRVGVVTHRDGRIDLIISKSDDPDACLAELPLTAEEAGALANLLGAPQLVAQLTEEHRDMPGIHTRQIPIESGSPYDGRTLGDIALRTRTGVSVVAVMRAGQVHPSPSPDFTLTAGDLMVTVGTSEGLDNAVKILRRG